MSTKKIKKPRKIKVSFMKMRVLIMDLVIYNTVSRVTIWIPSLIIPLLIEWDYRFCVVKQMF